MNNKLNISVTDSPGYGNKTDISEWRSKILNYIKLQFQNHFKKEQTIDENIELGDQK